MIRALTYNVSWATQSNTLAGSEKDFVKRCQKLYKPDGGKKCTKNAIKNIGTLQSLNVVFLQEVNSSIEPHIMKVQPQLKRFNRTKIKSSIVSILWDPSIFGKLVYRKSVNLYADDARPCLILLLQNNNQTFLLINVHMPHNKYKKHALHVIRETIQNDQILKRAFLSKSVKIIMGGDFNDSKTKIHNSSPLTIKNRHKSIKLKHILTKHHARHTLKSCCWHERGHKSGYFIQTGDYILVNRNIIQKTIKIPYIFKRRGRSNRMYSDHMPVISLLKL